MRGLWISSADITWPRFRGIPNRGGFLLLGFLLSNYWSLTGGISRVSMRGRRAMSRRREIRKLNRKWGSVITVLAAGFWVLLAIDDFDPTRLGSWVALVIGGVAAAGTWWIGDQMVRDWPVLDEKK